jgi:DNA polymerase-3 subunit epsilon
MKSVNRIIMLDTETTGLDEKFGRVVEIGCIELIDFIPTGNHFHYYLNPQGVKMSQGAKNITGIEDSMLMNKPTFTQIANEFLSFIENTPIVIHNAPFDIRFLRMEFTRCGKPMFKNTVIDTLHMARQIFPGKKCSLDAICKRLNINNDIRNITGHGALLDAKILGKVYYFLHKYEKKNEELFVEEEEIKIKEEFLFQDRDILYSVTEEESQLHTSVLKMMKK